MIVKKYGAIAFLLLSMVSTMLSCKDDEVKSDPAVEAWIAENEAKFNAKALDAAYTKQTSQGNDGFVYYKLLKEGTGKTVLYTDTVKVHYKGTLIDGTVFDENNEKDTPFMTPVKSGIIKGWTIALQGMKEGERREVWVPQALAYGESGQGKVKAYSTLIFEMEIIEITNRK